MRQSMEDVGCLRGFESVRASCRTDVALSSDELAVLWLVSKRQSVWMAMAQTMSSCSWKAWQMNLLSAVRKLRRYRRRPQLCVPQRVYACVERCLERDELVRYLGGITLWHSRESASAREEKEKEQEQGHGGEMSTVLELGDVEQQSRRVHIVPIEWLFAQEEEKDVGAEDRLFVALPMRVDAEGAIERHVLSRSVWKYTIPAAAMLASMDIATL